MQKPTAAQAHVQFQDPDIALPLGLSFGIASPLSNPLQLVLYFSVQTASGWSGGFPAILSALRFGEQKVPWDFSVLCIH